MYGWCCKCREKRPEEYKKLVGWEILFFSFLFCKYSIETLRKMLPNRNFCTYCGWPVEDNYPVGALCLALFLFPIGIIPCCLLKVSHSQPVPALSCLGVKSKFALPCLVSSRVALCCLILPCLVLPCLASSCLALSCLVLPCLGVRSNNRPTMQERQCVKCNRSSVWRGDHDSRLKSRGIEDGQIYSKSHI